MEMRHILRYLSKYLAQEECSRRLNTNTFYFSHLVRYFKSLEEKLKIKKIAAQADISAYNQPVFHTSVCAKRNLPLQPQENSASNKRHKSSGKIQNSSVEQSQENVAPGERRSEKKPNSSVQQSQKNVAARNRKSEKKPNSSFRFNYAHGHFPKINKDRLVRCKNEECKNKTNIFCSACNIHLCICIASDRNCFTEYHEIPKSDA